MFKFQKLLYAGILSLIFICLNSKTRESKENLAYLSMTINNLINSAEKLSLLKNITSDRVEIVNYNASYKDDIMEIALQNPDTLFDKGMSKAESTEAMLFILEDPNRIKRVLTISGRVIGFIDFFKVGEMKRDIRKIEDALFNFAKIEAIVVSENFRNKGYGKLLVRDAIDTIKKLWPDITLLLLDVQDDNIRAIKFYESEGFVKSTIQPGSMIMIDSIVYNYGDSVQYEKQI